MARTRSLLIGMAMGAVAAYLLDPELGAARRARLQRAVDGLAREVRDRADSALGGPGVAPAARPDDDLSLLNRVESALLGVSDVRRGSVETEVIDRHVVLRGEALSAEQERLLVATAGRVPGVAAVESRLTI